MARTIAEIKRTMTDAFMANATLREAYGLAEGDTFEGSFSAVSLENILFFIVAACCHVMEALFDRHRLDVVVATVQGREDKPSSGGQRAVVLQDSATVPIRRRASIRRGNFAMAIPHN